MQPLLFRRIVFVDWHGVLSSDPFWVSILRSNTHPVRAPLKQQLSRVFTDGDTADMWMRGEVSSEEVISGMAIQLDDRFRQDYLARRLHTDCQQMSVNQELAGVLRECSYHAQVVVATDNMDCFQNTFDSAQERRRSGGVATLATFAARCDGLVCSSSVGALKAEDPVRFFGPWLTRCGLDFPDALLIDDRADNCEAFRLQGGSALQWKMGVNGITEVAEGLQRWLASA